MLYEPTVSAQSFRCAPWLAAVCVVSSSTLWFPSAEAQQRSLTLLPASAVWAETPPAVHPAAVERGRTLERPVPASVPAARLEPAAERAPASAPDVAFDLSVGTHLPLSIGVDAQLELPLRFLVSLHLGWMPPAYVEMINATATAFGWYNEPMADLLAAAIQRSFVLRASVGWRPFEHEGFMFLFGYTLVTIGGGVTSAQAVQAVTGYEMDPRHSTDIDIQTVLHALHASVGWQWLLADHFLIRTAVGYVHTILSETSTDAGAAAEMLPMEEAERLVDDVLQTHALSPEVHLTAGYRF